MNILIILLALFASVSILLLFKILKSTKTCPHSSLYLNVKTLNKECKDCNKVIK